MTACPAAVRLPDWLRDVPAGSYAHHGRRLISWTFHEPGEIHRNRYQIAWIEVAERDPWKGEPLWLSAQRRTDTASYTRQAFTDTARDKMHAEVVPAVARFGFQELWFHLSRARSKAHRSEPARREADEVRRTAEWWSTKVELIEMHGDGLLDFEAVERAPLGFRDVMVRVCHPHQQRFSYEHPAARVLLDGEQVGWMLDNGDIVPTDEVIR